MVQALIAVRALLDPADERYNAQRELAAAGVLSALVTLAQVSIAPTSVWFPSARCSITSKPEAKLDSKSSDSHNKTQKATLTVVRNPCAQSQSSSTELDILGRSPPGSESGIMFPLDYVARCWPQSRRKCDSVPSPHTALQTVFGAENRGVLCGPILTV